MPPAATKKTHSRSGKSAPTTHLAGRAGAGQRAAVPRRSSSESSETSRPAPRPSSKPSKEKTPARKCRARHCDPQSLSDLRTVVCKGDRDRTKRTHVPDREYHVECVEHTVVDDDHEEFVCEDCSSMLYADRQILGDDYGNEKNITAERRDANFDPEYFVKDKDAQSDQDGEWKLEKHVSKASLQKWKKKKHANFTDPFANATSALDHDDRDRETRTCYNSACEHFEEGFWALAALTWDGASVHKVVQQSEHSMSSWTSLVTNLLCMTDHKVLKALCGPGLRWSKLRDAQLSQTLQKLRDAAKERPCHYVIEFVDRHGNGPTVGELKTIIEAIRDYLEVENPTKEQANLAVNVDGWDAILSDEDKDEIRHNGKRRYLFKDGKYLADTRDKRRPRILDFLKELEDNLQDFSDDEPSPFLLKDVGYTINGIVRLNQHESHTSSNAIMNLFEAVSVVLLGEDKYRMKGDVVFICGLPEQAEAGEVFWSLLCDSYTWTGRGFNSVHAGENQTSMKKHRDFALWGKRAAAAYNDGPFRENAERESHARASYLEEMEFIRGEIDDIHWERRQNEQALQEKIASLEEETERLALELEINAYRMRE